MTEFLIARRIHESFALRNSVTNGEIYVNENVIMILARSADLVASGKKSDTIFAENSSMVRRGK